MKQNRRYYLAYGSNLNVVQMKNRCPGAEVVGKTNLEGWELLFKGGKTGSYLTIEKAKDGIVPVAIWEVTSADEEQLDRYEGYPRFYYKKETPVKFRSFQSGRLRTVSAFVYIMHEDRKCGIPSDTYMEICKEGYLLFDFDTQLLEEAVKRSRERMPKMARLTGNFWKGFVLVGGSDDERKN